MSILTPNMLLPEPTVGGELAPNWAILLNNSLTIIDSHNHASGSGVQINPNGLNINADLPINSNNILTVRSIRFTPSTVGGAADLGCIYESGVDLWYNDANGNKIQLTANGGIAGTSGSIAGLTSPASATYVSGNQTFVWQSAASTPANLDAASIILRNLAASSKGLTLAPPAAMGANYTLVLPALPGAAAFVTLDTSGNLGTIAQSTVINTGGGQRINGTLSLGTPSSHSGELTIYNSSTDAYLDLSHQGNTGARIWSTFSAVGPVAPLQLGVGSSFVSGLTIDTSNNTTVSGTLAVQSNLTPALTVGTGGTGGAQSPGVVINGGPGAGTGPFVNFQRNSVSMMTIGSASFFLGGTQGTNGNDSVIATAAANSLYLYSGGAQALKLDTTQTATFAGALTAAAGSTIRGALSLGTASSIAGDLVVHNSSTDAYLDISHTGSNARIWSTYSSVGPVTPLQLGVGASFAAALTIDTSNNVTIANNLTGGNITNASRAPVNIVSNTIDPAYVNSTNSYTAITSTVITSSQNNRPVIVTISPNSGFSPGSEGSPSTAIFTAACFLQLTRNGTVVATWEFIGNSQLPSLTFIDNALTGGVSYTYIYSGRLLVNAAGAIQVNRMGATAYELG